MLRIYAMAQKHDDGCSAAEIGQNGWDLKRVLEPHIIYIIVYNIYYYTTYCSQFRVDTSNAQMLCVFRFALL